MQDIENNLLDPGELIEYLSYSNPDYDIPLRDIFTNFADAGFWSCLNKLADEKLGTIFSHLSLIVGKYSSELNRSMGICFSHFLEKRKINLKHEKIVEIMLQTHCIHENNCEPFISKKQLRALKRELSLEGV